MVDPDVVSEPHEDTAPAGTTGPWDVSDRPDLDGLIDFGSLRVPREPNLKIQIEADASRRPIGLAIIYRDSTVLQVNAFAAPRSGGMWDEVRGELSAQITAQGGQGEDGPGRFGTELRAVLAGRGVNGERQLVPARFIGVEGPRWLLRVMVRGRAAIEASEREHAENYISGIVVVRDGAARPPREVLPLTLPTTTQPGTSTES